MEDIESNLAEYHPNMVVAMMGVADDGGRHMPLDTLISSKKTPFVQTFRTYKLARLLWLRLLTKAEKMGLYKTSGERRNSGKSDASLPPTYFKKTSAESVPDEESLRKAIEIDPKNSGAYFALGVLYRGQGNFDQAEESFKKAIESNPENENAYVHLGWLNRSRNKFPQAEVFFKKAIELNPKSDDAYHGLGWLYVLQKKFPEAEASFKKAMELNPKNDNSYTDLGMLYKRQDKLSQAEAFLKKAIEINPVNENAYLALGGLYRQQEKSPQAEDAFKKANELRFKYYAPVTVNNYRKLKEILDRKGIKLVCMQYPLRGVGPLKRIFRKDDGVIFVDNERVFKEAVKRSGYKEYFRDMFGDDFGHCTQKGNELLAQNIADVILKEVFSRHKNIAS
jgi:tetratricopeptide (TPR) repeat protein